MLLYHLAPEATPDALRKGGYDWLAGSGLVSCQTGGGPAGVGGTVLADQALVPSERCRWQPSGQEWLATDCPGLHVGRWLDRPAPGPEDLARPDQLTGHLVELLDGNRWLAPIARGWIEEDGELRWYVALPQRLERREGTWQRGRVLPRYARLWEIAEQWEERWSAGIAAAVAHAAGEEEAAAEAAEERLAVELSLSDAADLAAECLAANYRVQAAEISLLGLFADATPAAVLDALIDRPARVAWAKKKFQPAPALANSSDGNAA